MRRSSFLVACAGSLLFVATGCTAPQDDGDERVGEAEQEDVVCPKGKTVEGIDVSVWQSTIDWNKVKGAGIQYAFARAAYGTSQDTFFDKNWSGMKSAGILRGAYQYWLPNKDPIAQADAMISIMGTLDSGDLPPVIDVEETDGVDPATMASRLGQWLTHMEKATGRKPIIYSGKYFWQDNVKSKAYDGYPLWIPNYSLNCPDLATGYWTDWQFFQYTSTGSVAGVSGNVDRDKWNGTLDDLKAFAGMGTPKYAAEFVSQSFPVAAKGPLLMDTGKPVTISLTMKNVGSANWDDSTRLATTGPRDRKSPFAGPEWPGANRYAQVNGTVKPGESYKFTWLMHPPAKDGTYDEHMGMVQEGVAWFSDKAQGGPPDDQLEGIFKVANPPGSGIGAAADIPVTEDFTPDTNNEGGTGGTGGSGGSVSSQKNGSCSVGNAGQAPSEGALFAAALGLLGLSRRRSRRGAPRPD